MPMSSWTTPRLFVLVCQVFKSSTRLLFSNHLRAVISAIGMEIMLTMVTMDGF